MFKLMGKEVNAILGAQTILIWTYVSAFACKQIYYLQEDILSLWNRTASDGVTTSRIRDTLKRVLNLPPNTIMEYKTHTDSIKLVLLKYNGLLDLIPLYGPHREKTCLPGF